MEAKKFSVDQPVKAHIVIDYDPRTTLASGRLLNQDPQTGLPLVPGPVLLKLLIRILDQMMNGGPSAQAGIQLPRAALGREPPLDLKRF